MKKVEATIAVQTDDVKEAFRRSASRAFGDRGQGLWPQKAIPNSIAARNMSSISLPR